MVQRDDFSIHEMVEDTDGENIYRFFADIEASDPRLIIDIESL
jgi:hypothetical protein